MTSSGRSSLELSVGSRRSSFQATSSAYFDTMTALSTGLGTRPLGSSRLAFDRLHRRAVPRAAYRPAPPHLRTIAADSAATKAVLIRERTLSVSDEQLRPN